MAWDRGRAGDAARGAAPPAGAAAVTAHWRDIAKTEAQRLLRLNDAVSRREAEWQRERDEWSAYRAEVDEQMRRESRLAAKGGRGGAQPSTPGGGAPGGGAPHDVSATKEALRRAQSHALNLRRERVNLEAELAKRRTAAATVEARLHRLRGALLQ